MDLGVASKAGWRSHVDAMGLTAGEKDALVASFDGLSDSHLIRAALLAGVESSFKLFEVPAERAAAYHAFCARFEAWTVFSYMPVADLIMIVAMAGRASWPELSITDAAKMFARHGIAQTLHAPLFRVLLKTCDGDFTTLLDITAQSNRLFFGHGNIIHEPVRPGHSRLHYEDHHTASMHLVVPSYHKAMLAVFGYPDGEVLLEVHDACAATFELRWA